MWSGGVEQQSPLVADREGPLDIAVNCKYPISSLNR